MKFSVRVGAESAELQDEDRIVGKWAMSLRVWVGGAPTITERFLNSPSDAESILRFTRQFGPLSYPLEKDPSKDRSFEFRLDDWRREQKRLTAWWDMFAGLASTPNATVIAPTVIEVIPRDQFQIDRTGLTFLCANLKHYMSLEIAALPAERLRRCLGIGCPRRFFARDLREKYCSDRCSATERRRAKLRYWDKNKQELLAERKQRRLRKSSRRRKKNGTSQT